MSLLDPERLASMVAVSPQLVVLYMIVASSLTSCIVSLLMTNHFNKGNSTGLMRPKH